MVDPFIALKTVNYPCGTDGSRAGGQTRRTDKSYEASTNTNGAQSRDTSAKISARLYLAAGRTRREHRGTSPRSAALCAAANRGVDVSFKAAPTRPTISFPKLTYSFRTPLIVTNGRRLALGAGAMDVRASACAWLDGQKHMPLFVARHIAALPTGKRRPAD